MPPDQPTNKPLKILKSRKRRSALIIAVVLTLVLGLGYFLYQGDIIRRRSDLPCTDNESLLERSNQVIRPDNNEELEELRGISNEIEGLSGHENDINCVYIIGVYYSYVDLPKAQTNLDKAKSLNEGGQRVSSIFGGRDVRYLEFRVDSEQTIQQEIDQNSIKLPNTETPGD